MEKQSLVLFVVALQSSGYTKSVDSVVIRIGVAPLSKSTRGKAPIDVMIKGLSNNCRTKSSLCWRLSRLEREDALQS